MKKITLIFSIFLLLGLPSFSQYAATLVKKVKAKLDKVNDYTADGKMKTDVAFIKAPAGKVKVLYKKPNMFKIKKENGISILPRGGISVNMSAVLSGNNYSAIASGESKVDDISVKVVKLLPTDESGDVVLTTLYIDEANSLIKKSVTSTKENGTFDMEMTYGKYADVALPDKVVFSFNTKDYKLPKGVTLEFETGDTPKQNLKNNKGRVEIVYTSYIINKGIADSEFK